MTGQRLFSGLLLVVPIARVLLRCRQCLYEVDSLTVIPDLLKTTEKRTFLLQKIFLYGHFSLFYPYYSDSVGGDDIGSQDIILSLSELFLHM